MRRRMRLRKTKILFLLVPVLAALALPTGASARRTHVSVALGDQSRSCSGARLPALKTKKVRYFIRWDAMRRSLGARRGRRLRGRRACRQAARAACTSRPTTCASEGQAAQHQALPARRRQARPPLQGARRAASSGVWNEANHKSQPTYRTPSARRQFYRVMRAVCHAAARSSRSTCSTSAASRATSGAGTGRSRAATARARSSSGSTTTPTPTAGAPAGTTSIIRTVRRYNRHAKFWLTETGGVVNFGRSFPCSERRAARSDSYMFTLAQEVRPLRRAALRLQLVRLELQRLRRRPGALQRHRAARVPDLQVQGPALHAIGRRPADTQSNRASCGPPTSAYRHTDSRTERGGT